MKKFRAPEIAKMAFIELFHSRKINAHKIWVAENVKQVKSEYQNLSNIDFSTKNLSDRTIMKFPHCAKIPRN